MTEAELQDLRDQINDIRDALAKTYEMTKMHTHMFTLVLTQMLRSKGRELDAVSAEPEAYAQLSAELAHLEQSIRALNQLDLEDS